MKVLLTSGRCFPSLTCVIKCSKFNYSVIRDKITMYDDKGKIISWTYLNDWVEVSYIDIEGKRHFIKSDFKQERNN